jgi:hypothetical protein
VLGEHRHKVKIEHETGVADPRRCGRFSSPWVRGRLPLPEVPPIYALRAVVASLDETARHIHRARGRARRRRRGGRRTGCSASRVHPRDLSGLQEIDAAARGGVAGDALLMPPGPPDSAA